MWNSLSLASRPFVQHRGQYSALRRMLIALATLCCLSPSYGATITVTNKEDQGVGSLRQAIADAQPNDTITFAVNVRGALALKSGELLISKALAIEGPGANLLTLDAGYASRVFRIDAHGKAVSILSLALARGQAPGQAGDRSIAPAPP
jgi:hypothetical protein